MNLSITSTADGPWRRISGVAASDSSSSANWIASTALAFGSGTRLSFAASTTPSVPSEPTISLARLNGRSAFDELVEVVAADPAQDLREPPLDLVARGVRASSRDRAVARAFEAVAARMRASSSSASIAARSARPSRPTARLPARGRDRWSCRRAPTARRSSCWPSCRRSWRGWPSRRRARTAARAAAAAAFSSSSTMPGSTRAQRSATFSSRMALQILRRVDDQARARSPVRPATCRRRAW